MISRRLTSPTCWHHRPHAAIGDVLHMVLPSMDRAPAGMAFDER